MPIPAPARPMVAIPAPCIFAEAMRAAAAVSATMPRDCILIIVEGRLTFMLVVRRVGRTLDRVVERRVVGSRAVVVGAVVSVCVEMWRLGGEIGEEGE